ncbi:hypothetical protein K402DRAFT_12569 [Aulographum hederae CBS 113979]|uniref:Uncharacterized protein n=1 Tax=Aulographum hederae CBS 113979 TaxID=1176131 RepID=A0A6G1H708_9PEZI|nr:hypothetical protein K402DRAFT_12569 [Aulographum hederae CBS 113979]
MSNQISAVQKIHSTLDCLFRKTKSQIFHPRSSLIIYSSQSIPPTRSKSPPMAPRGASSALRHIHSFSGPDPLL